MVRDLVRAIAAASSRSTKAVKAAFKKAGDLGLVAERMITPEKHEKLSLSKIYGRLLAIARTRVQVALNARYSYLHP